MKALRAAALRRILPLESRLTELYPEMFADAPQIRYESLRVEPGLAALVPLALRVCGATYFPFVFLYPRTYVEPDLAEE